MKLQSFDPNMGTLTNAHSVWRIELLASRQERCGR